ncbi:3'-5' exonuclease [Nitrosomonas ureae]|uniref:Exodeoxyribonuclease X n=1 Tax=Nitrosomonas ureae TaxID=44577 RepID=A0A1H2EQV7_9PROT|nr:exonuclease domain-containing protein [Nitrosomonas ureae]ALQ51870.1 DNA polymerase III subunit epsilon [Nitrosomonas ureae]SDT97333.1 exodeoxyribonuclease X [Nitrosomonas ureae]
MSKVIVFDTETTGIDDPEIIEAAWVNAPTSIEYIDSEFEYWEEFHKRYKPSKPISLSAMAIHHIMDEDLIACDPSDSFNLPDDIDYLIGHNVDFDWKASGSPVVNRICTLALSRYLWPDLPAHNQSAMLYFLEREKARELLRGKAHSAKDDVRNCIIILNHIFRKIGNIHTWEELWEISEIARIPTRMAFGKHKGMEIKDVPSDYKRWLMRQPDTDQYLLKALQS